MSLPTVMNKLRSLKPIKKDLLYREDVFATIRRVYTHLSELHNQEILDYYHVKNIKALETHIAYIKYILVEEIENYQEELSEIDTCFCVDAKGEFKYLYTHKEEAEKQIAYIQKIKRIKLSLYTCPYHCGWHLSRV